MLSYFSSVYFIKKICKCYNSPDNKFCRKSSIGTLMNNYYFVSTRSEYYYTDWFPWKIPFAAKQTRRARYKYVVIADFRVRALIRRRTWTRTTAARNWCALGSDGIIVNGFGARFFFLWVSHAHDFSFESKSVRKLVRGSTTTRTRGTKTFLHHQPRVIIERTNRPVAKKTDFV